MNLHSNVAKKRRRNQAGVLRFDRSRQVKFHKFKAKVTAVSVAFFTFSSVVGGAVYFLMGQAHLNALNDSLAKKTKELNSYNSEPNLFPPEKCDDFSPADKNLALQDRAEIFN